MESTISKAMQEVSGPDSLFAAAQALEGTGDYLQALKLYNEAHNAGHPEARAQVGVMLMMGRLIGQQVDIPEIGRVYGDFHTESKEAAHRIFENQERRGSVTAKFWMARHLEDFLMDLSPQARRRYENARDGGYTPPSREFMSELATSVYDKTPSSQQPKHARALSS
ncbi:MAG: hypothetical protein JKP92_03815 [Alphaproteobacteria bacterium]|jgi:TPR repeat protein|nr:hypothetical protein [Alphaproteobacteria bacterium]